ncbi:ArsR/SmtB family transcription factor [Actinoplanes aureus]|uniref:Winged helix-turn-helix transcriptional regulator n=1 Tax=Actinoplanes aureus TaxID=2792083 RepID=A0A931CHL6_9ACTN|nr:winged helix-turn-helix domain-containing protein [Actinoplanes aureus]MBG0568774.1 winged helix-turn-helix transcriptional regulator [Actinoplanes aureus]
MIRIELDEPTLARTRIAISPLGEAVCSLYLLHRNPGGAPWPYDAWARTARRILETDPATEPLSLYAQLPGASPDFIDPIPETALPTIGEQLERLRETPADVIGEQLDKHYPDGDVPEVLRPFRDDRRAALDRLAGGLAAYWDAAIAPHWPAMRAALDEEVLLRARALAADGPDALLARLHDRIRWERPVLTLVKPLEHSFDAVDQRLLLVPLIFSRGALMCSTDHPEVVMVTYQSRGAAVLAETPAPSVPEDQDRLAVLLGRGRASVLRALTVPATTTALAVALGLAPSTVSEHLTGLQAAGVVHRRRAGRRVLYGLEPAGTALVTLLTGDPTPIETAS